MSLNLDLSTPRVGRRDSRPDLQLLSHKISPLPSVSIHVYLCGRRPQPRACMSGLGSTAGNRPIDLDSRRNHEKNSRRNFP